MVYGQNESEHYANLHCLMQVDVKEGLVFNSKKCEIRTEQIKFFGTIYDSKGGFQRQQPTSGRTIRSSDLHIVVISSLQTVSSTVFRFRVRLQRLN